MVFLGEDYDPNSHLLNQLNHGNGDKETGANEVEETENLKLVDAEAHGASREDVHKSCYDAVLNMTKTVFAENIKYLSEEMIKNLAATFGYFCFTGKFSRKIAPDEFDTCECGVVLERSNEFLEIIKEVAIEKRIDISKILETFKDLEDGDFFG